jgi:hypothetical protein
MILFILFEFPHYDVRIALMEMTRDQAKERNDLLRKMRSNLVWMEA